MNQQLWVLAGTMDFTVGDSTWQLQTGVCLTMTLDQPIYFFNPTKRTTRYAVVRVLDNSTANRTL